MSPQLLKNCPVQPRVTVLRWGVTGLLVTACLPLLSGCPHPNPTATNNATTGSNAASGGATPRPFVPEPTPQTIPVADVSKAAFPHQAAAGSLHGEPFKVDRVLLQATSSPVMMQGHTASITQYNLTFHAGTKLTDLREVVVHLNMKSGTKLPGQLITAQPATLGTPAWQQQHGIKGAGGGVPLGVAGVHITWVPKDQPVPQSWYVSDKFSLRLQFGQPNKSGLPGQIILRLPDKEKSWVGGNFTLTPEPQDPEPAWNGPPVTVAAPRRQPRRPTRRSRDRQHLWSALPCRQGDHAIEWRPDLQPGKSAPPDRDITIFLFLNTNEKLEGKTYQIKPNSPPGMLIPHLSPRMGAQPQSGAARPEAADDHG